jgi:hypothetical protein
VSLHDAVSRDPSQAGAWANRGLVIRSWRARLGGKECGPWLAEHGIGAGDQSTSTADMLPPPEVQRLEPGDFLDATIEHLVVPQFARDYYGPNENLRAALRRDENTWRLVHREATGNDLLVEATEGKVEQTRPIVIRSAFDCAGFSITGGRGYVPLTIRGLGSCGLGSYRAPQLEWKMHATEENWQVIDQATLGNDFWQTDFDPSSETWELTFTVPADLPDDRRDQRDFRFVLTEH